MIPTYLRYLASQNVGKLAKAALSILLGVIPLLLLGALLTPRAAAVTSTGPLLVPGNPVTHPAGNTHTAPATTTVSITYDEDISATTVSTRTFAVHAMQTGLLPQTYGVQGGTIILTPPQPFRPGELVQVSATTGTLGLSGQGPVSPTVWQFRTAVMRGGGVFVDGPDLSGDDLTQDLALGDLDGDGDLDVFVANSTESSVLIANRDDPGIRAVNCDFHNTVWMNDGTGAFTDSGQSLGTADSQSVALGDLDGDGDLDALVGNNGSNDEVWLNDGAGIFEAVSQDEDFGSGNTSAVALGDLDGDGDLDVFVAKPNGVVDEVRFNDGTGHFTITPAIDSFGTDVKLGDLDGDSDLDAFVATDYGDVDRVLLNSGDGSFIPKVQAFPESESQAVALGDVDGDGDLDAFVVASDGDNRVWLNDGTATFTDSLQSLGTASSRVVALGDLDGDGDLDAFVGNAENDPNMIWLNDGTGAFTTTQSLGRSDSRAVVLGDMDGDSDLDALDGNYSQPNQVWLNVTPEVRINQIIPNPSFFGEWVEFNGSGTTVTVTETLEEYEWTRLPVAETCGTQPNPFVLGRAALLSINSTPVGTHANCLRARNGNGIWSDYDAMVMQVREDPSAQSDIAVSRDDISFWIDQDATITETNPNIGDQVHIEVTVHNISLHSVTDTVTVSVYDGDAVSGTLVATDVISPIAAVAARSVVVPWTVGSDIDGTPIDGYDDGYKVLTVDIEYTDNIDYFALHPTPPWDELHIESTYENNQATAFIVVGPPITGTYAISVTADILPIDETELYAGYAAHLLGEAYYNWGSRIPVMGAETSIEIVGVGVYSDVHAVWTTAPFGRYISTVQLPPITGTYTATIAVFDNNLVGVTVMTFTVAPPPEQLPDLYVDSPSVSFTGPAVYQRDWHEYTSHRVYYHSGLFGIRDEPITITARVVNGGNLDADPFGVSFYDGSPYGGTRLGTITVTTGLISGTSTTVAFVWTPTQTHPYDVRLVVDEADDIRESNEVNNYDADYYKYHRDVISIRARNPDLRATDLLYAEPNNGETVTMTATVKNIGHDNIASGDGFTVAIYDGYPGISNTMRLMETRVDGPMDHNDDRTIDNIIWPTGGGDDPGQHHICVAVDTDAEIAEELEENNVNCWDPYVFPLDHDLYPVDLAFSRDAPLPGTPITITATIENRGAYAFTDTAVITFYEGPPSDGNVIGAPMLEGPIAGRRGRATISAGYTTTDTHGSLYIYVEYVKNEGHNPGSRIYVGRLTIYPDPPPDLQIRSSDIHISPRPPVYYGDLVNVGADIANVGVTTATDFTVWFHTDSPSQGLVQLGSPRIVSSLAPGMTATVQASAPFEATDPYYAIKVEARPSVQQGDDHFSDNEATTSIPVLAPPDLTISKDVVSNQLNNSNYPTLKYILTITNTGDVTATGPFTVTDIMPSGLSFESAWSWDWSWDCSAVQNLTVTCTYPGSSDPDASTQFYVRASSSDVTPTDAITNCATVDTSNADDPANNTACHVLLLGSIAGAVTDTGGLPLEDIAVIAYRDGDFAGWYQTDATGLYTLTHLEVGTYVVGFRDWSYPRRYYDEYYDGVRDFDDATPVSVTKSTTTIIDAVLDEIPAGNLTGTVTDPGGLLLADMYVVAYRNGSRWGYAGGTRTDAAGCYTLTHLQVGTYTVEFRDWSWPDRYYDEYYDGVRDFDDAVPVTIVTDITTTVDAVLDRIARGNLTGTVTGPYGPLQNISVIAKLSNGDRWDESWASTDATGRYALANLQVGTYTVKFRDWYEGYRNEYYDNVSDFDDASFVSIVTDTTAVVNATLGPLTKGTITGTVAMSGGMGLERIDVVAYPLYVDQESYARSDWRGSLHGAGWGWSRNWLSWAVHHPEIGTTATDAALAFTLTLPTGPYRLYFRDMSGNFEPQYYQGVGSLAEATVITVTEGMSGVGTEVILHPSAPPNAQLDATPFSSMHVGNGVQGIALPWPDQPDIALDVTAHLSPCVPGTLTAALWIRELDSTSVLLAGPYAMNPTGSPDEYIGSIPGIDLVDGDVVIHRYCNGQLEVFHVAVIEIYDPSGQITEKATGNPVPGATVILYQIPGWRPKATPFDDIPNTCQSYNSKMPSEPWSQPVPVQLAGIDGPAWTGFDPPANPQIVDRLGYYTWDFAEGCWYVVVEAEGYARKVSPVVGVPPQVTDLDLALMPYQSYLPVILRDS